MHSFIIRMFKFYVNITNRGSTYARAQDEKKYIEMKSFP